LFLVFFLFAVCATLDIGFKSWQMGETKSDLHQKAEILLNRIIKEFSYTNSISLQIENGGDPNSTVSNTYLCFQTPVNKNNNTFEKDTSPTGFGCPVWQGYILYYMRTDPENVKKKNIYRRFVEATPSIQPAILTSITNYINATGGENVRTVVKDIYDIDFDRKGDMVIINISFQRDIRKNAMVAFSPGSNKGIEIINMKATAKARN